MPTCQSCALEVPKKDRLFVDEETFGFLTRLPAGISIGLYCPVCHASHVQPALDRYIEALEAAKNVNMFYRTQSKECRFVRRIESPVEVHDCDDKDEAILRLAFLAVQAGKNALVDVEVRSRKIIDGGYQSSSWSGRAVPADIEESQLQRRFPGTPN